MFVVGGVGGMCFVRVLVPLCVVWVYACVCVGGVEMLVVMSGGVRVY